MRLTFCTRPDGVVLAASELRASSIPVRKGPYSRKTSLIRSLHLVLVLLQGVSALTVFIRLGAPAGSCSLVKNQTAPPWLVSARDAMPKGLHDR